MPPIALQVEGLTARVPGGEPLVLDDVSFTVRRGWLVGIVGPTGAGKTSLLAALTGRLAATAGTVCVAGRPVATGTSVIPGVAHVPQDDVLHGRLGLRRTLHHAATLRLPRGTDGATRTGRIDQVLADLGLTDKARAAIDTLSGGERKRANVAVELVGRPDVVLLDEPTSGLDPGHEQAVLGALRQVADGGRTVVAVTHGLAALSVCDRVLVLGRGGQVAFFGPPAAARTFFGSLDAASLFRDLDSAEGTARWAARFRAHPAYAQLVAGGNADLTAAATPDPVARPRRRTQLATLVHRAIELTVADRRRLALLALQGPVLGLLLLAVLQPHGFGPASAAGPGAATVAMFLAVSATWLGAATAVREIVDELPIVRRERGAGLSLGMYVASKAMVLGSIAAVQAAALTAIAILRQDAPTAGAVLPSGPFELVVTAGLVGLAAVALGLCVSALVTTSEKALTLLPLVLVTQLVLAGPWSAHADTPGLGVARSLTLARWGAESIEATGRGDARAWWAATAALLALTAAAAIGTFLLVRRHAGVHRRSRDRGLLPRPATWLVPSAAVATLVAALVLLPSSSGTPRTFTASGYEPPPASADAATGEAAPTTAAPAVTVATTPSTTPAAPVVEPVRAPAAAAPAAIEREAAEVEPVEPQVPAPATTVPPPPAPTTTTTTAPQPATTTTTVPAASGGTTTAASSWDWIMWWWAVSQAYG